MLVYTCTYMHTYTPTYIHDYIPYSYINTYLHTYIPACIHAYMLHAYTPTHTYIPYARTPVTLGPIRVLICILACVLICVPVAGLRTVRRLFVRMLRSALEFIFSCSSPAPQSS